MDIHKPITIDNKLDILKSNLKKYKSAIVAFSAGVDSTFLAKVASEVIDNLLLVTATSESFPFYELEESKELANLMGVEHRIIITEEMKVPGYKNNTVDRCYYCKSELYFLINHLAKKEGYEVVFDGTNADDIGDYRPGRKAAKEKDVVSPLAISGFTKDDIRFYSREYKLPTAEKPAMACLASRVPYGETITKEKLGRIAITEYNIRQLGFSLFRVRSHENLARIEFAPDELEKAWAQKNKISSICRELGFDYVTYDLDGYRSGSMNEAIEITSGVVKV